MYDAYPLQWPDGYKRTPDYKRISSQFKQTMERAQQFLRMELNRLGATGLIVSTNIPVRKDGGLYADYMSRKIDDPGVAIYFTYGGKQVSMCCDQYSRVWENIYALGRGIEALRGMERWGVSEFLNRAFTGFTAIENAPSMDIWEVLGLKIKPASKEVVVSAYKQKAMTEHPDRGGSHERFIRLQKAYETALSLF